MGRNFSFETYSASLTNEMRQSYFVRGKRYKVSKKKKTGVRTYSHYQHT